MLGYTSGMPKVSAGLLMYRRRGGRLEVLLVHPGGPFWRNKDAGAWTVPKGEVPEGEDLLVAARREFKEELGVRPAIGVRVKLASRGTGRWRSSAGYRAKFGLTLTELLDLLDYLKHKDLVRYSDLIKKLGIRK